LTGFFDNPQIKRHLRQTGVITRKRKFSLTPIKQLVDHQQRPASTAAALTRSAQLASPPPT
jgi:hypothetical protein